MSYWCAEIKARPKHFKCLVSATVTFEADDFESAEEQANAYCDRLGMYDAADVDSLYELARRS